MDSIGFMRSAVAMIIAAESKYCHGKEKMTKLAMIHTRVNHAIYHMGIERRFPRYLALTNLLIENAGLAEHIYSKRDMDVSGLKSALMTAIDDMEAMDENLKNISPDSEFSRDIGPGMGNEAL